MLCDECGEYEIPDDLDCCRVCFSVRRRIPHDDMTDDEFRWFTHRMRKLEKEEDERRNKKVKVERQAYTTQQEAWLRAQTCTDFEGDLQACQACKQLIRQSVGICLRCYRRNMESLRATGLPTIAKEPPPTGFVMPHIRGVFIDEAD
jgi:hypothetical protein